MRIIRKSLTITERFCESKKIANIAFNYNIFRTAKNIACFLSFDGEIDTYPLIRKLWLNKKNVFVPIIQSVYKKKIFFVSLNPKSILYRNQYNIFEPYYNSNNIISERFLDIVIVPLVACDLKGSRLGLGGGFYDNFLKNWKLKKFIPIGFSYDFQLIYHDIPKKYWDISLPILLTPNKIYFFE